MTSSSVFVASVTLFATDQKDAMRCDHRHRVKVAQSSGRLHAQLATGCSLDRHAGWRADTVRDRLEHLG